MSSYETNIVNTRNNNGGFYTHGEPFSKAIRHRNFHLSSMIFWIMIAVVSPDIVLPSGQLLKYLVECDEDECRLDSEFKTVFELLKSNPEYVYENLNNFECNQRFLVSFLK